MGSPWKKRRLTFQENLNFWHTKTYEQTHGNMNKEILTDNYGEDAGEAVPSKNGVP